MKTEKLELSASCHLELTTYDGGIWPAGVTLEYVEYACDHYSSDVNTSITICPNGARKIIAFLTAAFGEFLDR